MKKSKEVQIFIEENCKDCKEKCDFGIIETATFVRCIDKNITISKKK